MRCTGEYRRRMVQEANAVATSTLKVRIHKGLVVSKKIKNYIRRQKWSNSIKRKTGIEPDLVFHLKVDRIKKWKFIYRYVI
jgi:hypothetical protein